MAKIRVLIVEDSLTVRERLIEVLTSDPDFEVVGDCADGKEAIALCLAQRPDVITMDIVLPVMSGLAATEYIMAHCPTPTVIVSSSLNRGELFRTYDALAAGAVDVIEKPHGDEEGESWERMFLASVKRVARIKVITHLRGRLQRSTIATPPSVVPLAASLRRARKLVAIGASTGGPGALMTLFRGLSSGFTLPILLVLHIGPAFGSSLAEWLDGLSSRRVSLAKDGEALPKPGDARVLLAPPDKHLRFVDGQLRLTSEPERHSCRPSVDVLFESLAALGPEVAACLLTGMGKDGAAGMLAMRRAGAATVAQDEASSVVFGMPREAVLLGAAQSVLPIDRIASWLTQEAEVGRGVKP